MFGQQINSIRNILNSTEPMDCFKLQFKALRILGAFHNSSANKFLYFASLVPLFLILKLCGTSIMYLIADDISLNDKFQSTFVSNTSLLCVIKLYYIRKHQVKLIHLVKALKTRVNNLNEDETKVLNKEAIYPTAASYLMLQTAIFGSCVTYNFLPIGKNNEGELLPVYAWYPHYFNQGIPYKVVYFLQEMSITCAGTLWVCVDTINFGLLAHHNVMLKILSQRIAKLGWTGQHTGAAYNAQNYETLCEYVKYHIQILKYQSEAGQIYSSILFAKITLSVIIICSFAYTLTTVCFKSFDNPQMPQVPAIHVTEKFSISFTPQLFIYMPLALLLSTLQIEHEQYGSLGAHFVILCVIVSTLYVISWMSENISVSSNELLNKAAECNFQCMDHKTTKALIIFMQGLSTTVCIEVGGTLKVRLNLKMFVTIIEFAYKCLALLKTATVST